MADSRIAPTFAARLFPFAFSTTAGAPARTRPGRHIPFEPHPRLTPSAPPPPVVPPGQPSVSARLARLGVWLLLALGWAVFAAWWVVVLRRESVAAFTRAGAVLAGVLAVCAVIMSAWTRYNMWVARRGMRGRSSRYIPVQWERDTLGRPLRLPEGSLARSASELRIVLHDGAKSYVVVATEDTL
ncbi:MAG TPA: hypothetical protein VFZ21_14875 [Gemmatimonadaceae bacterium]|nr:hypothetical protein [Gemmatimonadaceae bacterium]